MRVKLLYCVKISFLVVVGIILIVLGFIGFLVPITDSGLNVLEVDELCQKGSDSFSPQELKVPQICELTKFFNAIYFLFAIGLVLIFWSGFLDEHYWHKKS